MRAEPWEHHEQADLVVQPETGGGALKTSRPEAERGSGPEEWARIAPCGEVGGGEGGA